MAVVVTGDHKCCEIMTSDTLRPLLVCEFDHYEEIIHRI